MVSETSDSFPDGSIIVVDPGMQALAGDYVVALNSDNNTTFRQLIEDDRVFFLKPLNLNYRTEPLGSASIIGVVCAFTKRFR